MTEALNGKRLAVFGGNNILKEVVRFAHCEGVTVVTFAQTESSAGHHCSDEKVTADITDPGVILPLLKEKKIDAILAVSGEKLLRKIIPWISKSGYRYFITDKQWDEMMNKRRFKDLETEVGLPILKAYRLDELRNKAMSSLFPMIVKPVDSSGSTGITICKSPDMLDNAVTTALSQSSSGDYVIERYVDGPYFQFEIWMQNGRAYFPYTKGRIFYQPLGNNPSQPFLDIYPSPREDILRRVVFNRMEELLRRQGIHNGSCMFQGVFDGNTPYIIDTALRISGGMDYTVVKEEKGVDLIEAHISYALGGAFGEHFEKLEEPFRHHYATMCVGMKNGRISRMSDLTDVYRIPGVYEAFSHYRVGDIVKGSGTFSQVGWRIFMYADDDIQLKASVSEVLETLKIEDETGESMILPAVELR